MCKGTECPRAGRIQTGNFCRMAAGERFCYDQQREEANGGAGRALILSPNLCFRGDPV